jgi:hypothetical protein
MEQKKAEIKSLQKINGTENLEIDGNLYIRQINPSVVIMPYTLNSDGTPDQIGIINEISNQKPDGIIKTLITGSPDDNDENIFQTAVRELREESGFDVSDLKRWNFLGSLYTSKLVLNTNPCFSVNVTSLVASDRSTDGSKSEKDSKFELVDVQEALNIEDSLISTLFIKTFKNLFNKNQEKSSENVIK